MVEELRKRFKDEAKLFRMKFKEAYGQDLGHGECLERVSKIYGFRDWNTFSAAINSEPERIAAYARIFGGDE